ncbi:MAG: RDD family protein [Undibacterium sp.]|nr:RDD family protein [Undibacterium sp.]
MLTGRLSLITPEGVRLILKPAGPAVRAWAWAIDAAIYAVTVGLLGIVYATSTIGKGVYLISLFVLYWGYPILCEVYAGGRTLGKRVMGLQVIRADGLPVGWREATIRNLLLAADFLPFLYFTGLLCMLFDRQFRRVGDIVAGSLVVYRESSAPRPVLSEAAAIALPYPLNPEQQRTLIGLFEREKNIPVERLLELATLAEPLTGLTGESSLKRLRGFVAGLSK